MCDHCSCRTFAPIAELTADHEEILRLAWDLAEADRLRQPVDPDTKTSLRRLLAAHVVKEETGLYPALVSAGRIPETQIITLEQEHRDLHDVLESGVFDRNHFYALAAHIEDEEMELFPAAMLDFDEEEWEATNGAHRAVERAAGVAS